MLDEEAGLLREEPPIQVRCTPPEGSNSF